MKSRIPLFALCAILASPGFSAEKKERKGRKSGHSTLPPVSPMLMISADPGSTVDSVNSSGLITTKLGGRDLDFFETLLATGRLQVLLGDLMKTKAESPQVKYVAVTLASTQGKENEQISRLATLNGLSLSARAEGAQRQTSADLEKLSGAIFDSACVDKIIEANRSTVHAYEEGAESTNQEIHAFSEIMLPIARDRLRIAEKMIERPQKPAPGSSTPAPQTFPVQLRPPPPYIPGTPAPSSPAPATPAGQSERATPANGRETAPLTLGQKPPAGPFPAPSTALPTPPPLTESPGSRRVIDRVLPATPPPLTGAPATIPPPTGDAAAPSSDSAKPAPPKLQP